MATKLMGPEQPTISPGPHLLGQAGTGMSAAEREDAGGWSSIPERGELVWGAAVSLSPAKPSRRGELQGCLAKRVGFAQLPARPRLRSSARCSGCACPRCVVMGIVE